MNNISFRLHFEIIPFIILLFILSIGCKSESSSGGTDPSLKLLATYNLQIQEPSGITFNQDYSACWIVDGKLQVVYKTDLKGNIVSKLSYKGQDLEGITFDKTDQSLWVVEERLREVVHLDQKGNELERFKINISGKENKGLEGIAIDDKHNFYVLNQKKPKALFALDKNFKVTAQYDFTLSKDLSDMDFDPVTKNFFILSAASQAIFIWNLQDGLKKSYSLPYAKCEGIAVNPNRKLLFITNDALNTMYVYEYK